MYFKKKFISWILEKLENLDRETIELKYKISDKLKVRMRFVLISFKALRVLRVSRRETPFLLSVKKIGNFHLYFREN